MMRPGVIIAVLALQIVCALSFVVMTFSALFGISPIPWQVHEMIELGAVAGLFVGAGLLARMLRQSLRRTRAVEDQLRAASGAFMELLEQRFEEWALTPAERDVALFAIKGLSTSEIAAMRETSDGTVKAQTNAIYRKAGVNGRPQLLSMFIDDLMEGPLMTSTDQPAASTEQD